MTILNRDAGKTAPELRSEFDHLMLIFAICNAKNGCRAAVTRQLFVTVAARTRLAAREDRVQALGNRCRGKANCGQRLDGLGGGTGHADLALSQINADRGHAGNRGQGRLDRGFAMAAAHVWNGKQGHGDLLGCSDDMARDGGPVQGVWLPSRGVLILPALDLCRVGAPL